MVPNISRASLPSVFVEAVDGAFLMQPQPQYLGAGLIFMAEASAELTELAIIMPNGMPLQNPGGVGALAPPELGASMLDLTDPLQRASVMLRGEAFISRKFPEGKASDTVRFDRLAYTDSTYTRAARDTTRAAISTTPIGITGEQVTIALKEASGPYSNAAGAVVPFGIEGFDLNMLQKSDVIQRTVTTLRRDRMKYLDAVVWADMVAAPATTSYVYPGDYEQALTTDAAAFLTQGDRAVDMETVQRTGKILAELGIPTFSNGKWMMVLSPKQIVQLKRSVRYNSQAVYVPQHNPLLTGYVSSIDNFDIFQCATLPTTTTGSITVQRGVAFGPGAFAYANVTPCHFEVDNNTNYNRRLNLIWTLIEGSGVVDNRFVVSVRSD